MFFSILNLTFRFLNTINPFPFLINGILEDFKMLWGFWCGPATQHTTEDDIEELESEDDDDGSSTICYFTEDRFETMIDRFFPYPGASIEEILDQPNLGDILMPPVESILVNTNANVLTFPGFDSDLEARIQALIQSESEARRNPRTSCKPFVSQRHRDDDDDDKPKPTAFPVLGADETCSCWMFGETHKLTDRKHLVATTKLFLPGTIKGLGAIGTAEDFSEYVLIPGIHDNKRHFFVFDSSPCGCWSAILYSATTCHLTTGLGLTDGHDVRQLASFNFKVIEGSNQFILNSSHQYALINLPGLNIDDMDDLTVPRCHHTVSSKAPIAPKGYTRLAPRRFIGSDSGAKIKVDLVQLAQINAPEIASSSHQDPISSNWSEVVGPWTPNLEARISDHWRAIGNKTVTSAWHDAIANAWAIWEEPIGQVDTARMKQSGHDLVPEIVKSRYRRCKKLLNKAAIPFKATIKADKSFDATTYQEWAEQERRRYEDIEAMSATQAVKASNSVARAWLKTANAKHQMAAVVRAMVSDEDYGKYLLQRMNNYFVNNLKGVKLTLPNSTWDKIKTQRSKLDKLAQAQASAARLAKLTEAEEYARMYPVAAQKARDREARRQIALQLPTI
jgi:hypothetical protein